MQDAPARTTTQDRRSLSPFRLAWKFGGPEERLFVILIYTAVAHVIVLAYFCARMVQFEGWPINAMWAAIVAAILFPPFQEAFIVPMYSPHAIREGIRQGKADGLREYYEALAKYKEIYGVRGQLPWDRAWGVAYWAIFYCKQYVAILVTLLISPALGEWSIFAYAGMDLPISLALFGLYKRKNRSQFLEADRRGFPLIRLRKGASMNPWK